MTRTTVDLRALKAARAEATGETLTVAWDEETFDVPTEIPLAVLSRLRSGDIDGAAVALLGQEQADRFLALDGVSVQDFSALVESVTGIATGAPVGESTGSSES